MNSVDGSATAHHEVEVSQALIIKDNWDTWIVVYMI